MRERPPNLRAAKIYVLITWAGAVLGVALGVMLGQWLVVIWAAQCTALALAWLLSMERWEAWRKLAQQLMAALEDQTRRPDL